MADILFPKWTLHAEIPKILNIHIGNNLRRNIKCYPIWSESNLAFLSLTIISSVANDGAFLSQVILKIIFSSLVRFLKYSKTTGHETWLDQINQHSFQLNPIHLENGLLRILALFQSRIEHPMWGIFLFTGLLLISSSLLGLLPFMAVLWFISCSKDETFSHLLGSQKFTVYLVWMVVGAFMTHLFGGDIFPTYFKMIDDYLISISNSSWTNKTCLKYNQPHDTGDWNLKNFF